MNGHHAKHEALIRFTVRGSITRHQPRSTAALVASMRGKDFCRIDISFHEERTPVCLRRNSEQRYSRAVKRKACLAYQFVIGDKFINSGRQEAIDPLD